MVLSFLLFVFGCTAVSVIYTFIFIGTRGSLLLVALFHGSENVLVGWVWLEGGAFELEWMAVHFGVQAVVAALLVWRFGAAHLSPRGKVTFAEEA